MTSFDAPTPPRAPGGSPPVIVVMGVSGCGKSTVATMLAQALGLPYLEADELHPSDNVGRMAAGIPLTDADRQGWLRLLSERIGQARAQGQGLVVACSALKRAYRDVLRQGAADLLLVYLRGSAELLAERMRQRQGHFMPASLLTSQLAALEPPQPDEAVVTVDIAQSAQTMVHTVLAVLGDAARDPTRPDAGTRRPP